MISTNPAYFWSYRPKGQDSKGPNVSRMQDKDRRKQAMDMANKLTEAALHQMRIAGTMQAESLSESDIATLRMNSRIQRRQRKQK